MDSSPLLLINTATTLALAIVALWLGYQINRRIDFLNRYSIPPAVTGGLPISAIVALSEVFSGWQIRFDLELRDLLLIAFFSTIGLSAKLRQMLDGGKALAIMLGLAVLFLIFQNLTGVALALLAGESPLYGLIGGSISLAGGHGTAITWGQMFEEHFGLANASTLGMTFATAGLISGGLVGGPVAAYLIRRHQLEPNRTDPELPRVTINQQTTYLIELNSLLTAVLLIALCFALGASVYDWLSGRGMRLPAFLTAMFLGIVLSNGLELCRVKLDARPIQLVGDLSLQLFLGMSLISLPLLSLQGALGLISLVMLMQALVIALFSIWLVFPLLGRNYDAACISAGFIGMGLGATPVGIANMNALTNRFGPSPKAYLVIPLLGAFFIDIANAGLVQLLLGLNWLTGAG
ncbi:glutamate:Na+ symporter, ESS family [Pseudomonas guineae]|uniref:Sodium/glutamate symporter n=1 Tax=Pseudomonas guineae TaxID=425504 RepID=A0A1I3G2C6_9PSED|nr:sodium/glutamate symporter [Pseudomonas guineae]SFI17620.1 glutamate:Na+ symporter, ESS family [Pseudomonas guineae]|tara:strand:+ start:1219 stop:2439 length:1221 start_codon:yes stop_codon:yes gene_type:complete